ncbi:hypothetical protein KIPB_009346, partial [Kipferlia bialata]
DLELEAAFGTFVEALMDRDDITLLRRVLMFATGSPLLPQMKIGLVLDTEASRAALPAAHLCDATISVPKSCLSRLDIAFLDSMDASGITVGSGDRLKAAVTKELDENLNRFRILSPNRRTCPKCGVAIEKLDDKDCNHIECHCGIHFCYLCGYSNTSQRGVYAHMTQFHGGFGEG